MSVSWTEVLSVASDLLVVGHVLWYGRFIICPVLQIVGHLLCNPCSHGITWKRLRRVATENPQGGVISLTNGLTIVRRPSQRNITLIPTEVERSRIGRPVKNVPASVQPLSNPTISFADDDAAIDIDDISDITMTSTSGVLTGSALSAASGKVSTKVLQTWAGKALSDFHIVYSIGVDAYDEAQTLLSKLGPIDPATLVALTQSSLTTLLTDFANVIDPSLPASLQAVLASGIPLVVKQIVVLETKLIAAITAELPAGFLSCITGATKTVTTTPASTTTVAVTPAASLTYVPACAAPASGSTASAVASSVSSPVLSPTAASTASVPTFTTVVQLS